MVSAERPQRKSRRDRFLEIAQRRTRQILRDLRLLGNCGNTGAYEYNEAEIQKIFAAIEQELAKTRSRFRTGVPKEVDFRL